VVGIVFANVIGFIARLMPAVAQLVVGAHRELYVEIIRNCRCCSKILSVPGGARGAPIRGRAFAFRCGLYQQPRP